MIRYVCWPASRYDTDAAAWKWVLGMARSRAGSRMGLAR